MSWLANRRRGVGKQANPYLMTSETNPEVLAVCYAQGWCASPDYMTYDEAARVSSFFNVFENNNNITHFDELEHFTSLTGGITFRNCKNLLSIKLPNLTELGTSMFNGCNKLQTFTVPASVTKIGNYAFYQCALNSVTIMATTPPTLANQRAFNFSTGNATYPIYVPEESVDTYKAASVWSELSNRIFAIPT